MLRFLTLHAPELINLCASIILLIAFAMLAQRKILALINLFAMQGFMLCVSTALVAFVSGQSHLYWSALLTLILKVLLLPWILHRLIRKRSEERRVGKECRSRW